MPKSRRHVFLRSFLAFALLTSLMTVFTTTSQADHTPPIPEDLRCDSYDSYWDVRPTTASRGGLLKIIGNGTIAGGNWLHGEEVEFTLEDSSGELYDLGISTNNCEASTSPMRAVFQVPLDAAVGEAWVVAIDGDDEASAMPVEIKDPTKALYIALGDSVASGHGLGGYGHNGRSGKASGPEECLRSNLAYPNQADVELDRLFPDGVDVTHLACTGATAKYYDYESNGYRPEKNLDYQAAEAINILTVKVDEDYDGAVFISVTIGANDAELPNLFTLPTLLGTNDFDKEVKRRTSDIDRNITASLTPLVRQFPFAEILLTQYGNPLPERSYFFALPKGRDHDVVRKSFPRITTVLDMFRQFTRAGNCGASLISPELCHERSVQLFAALNAEILAAAEQINKYSPDTVSIVDSKWTFFGGHEGPYGLCGLSGPSTAETFVQYPLDGTSDATAHLHLRLMLGLVDVPRWSRWVTTGDCIHPNVKGAKSYATGVVLAVKDIYNR